MNTFTRTVFGLTATLALAGQALQAQSNNRGLLSGWPMGMVYDEGVGQARQIWDRPAGYPQALQVFTPISSQTPLFHIQAMFPATHQLVEIDAMSTGNFQLPIDGPKHAMEVDPLNPVWAVFSFSLQGSVSSPQLASLVQDPANAGSDILSFYLENSVGVKSSWYAETFLEYGIADTVHPVPSSPEVVAFDGLMSAIVEAKGVADPALFPVVDRFYFSLTHASAAAVSNTVDFPGNPTGNTIYQLTWDSVLGVWKKPTVIATHVELGILPGDEVDALAIRSRPVTSPPANQVQWEPEFFVFSTDNPQRNEILLAEDGINGSMPLRAEDSDAGGLKDLTALLELSASDAIDGICGQDPEGGDYSAWFGSPAATVGGLDTMTLSFSREDIVSDSGDYQDLVMSVSAIPDAGTVLDFELSLTGFPPGMTFYTTPVSLPANHGGSLSIRLTQIPGMPSDLAWLLDPIEAASGLHLEVTARVADSGGTNIFESFPCVMFQ